MDGVSLRPGTAADSQRCFRLFWHAISDLAARLGTPWEGSADDRWPHFAALYRLLAEIAAEWWVAEEASTGEVVGYARSVERGTDGGLLELSEFFVRPGRQSGGVGRELLERAFPIGRGEVRAIIATTDVRAVARYHKADTSIQFPILGMTGAPSAADPIGLDAEPLITETVGAVAEIERQVIGFERDSHELEWLLAEREGYLYRDAVGAAIGVAFIGPSGGAGPIAATDPSHLPAILLHLEDRAHASGHDSISFEVPAPNVVAIRHLLGRGLQLDPFVTYLMANRPFGRFDRFIGFSPPFVL